MLDLLTQAFEVGLILLRITAQYLGKAGFAADQGRIRPRLAQSQVVGSAKEKLNISSDQKQKIILAPHRKALHDLCGDVKSTSL
ncbi:hypothetical protein [Photobacterium sp.]|uniref:hypothetical protein n=1 Tax=Photobacterium sp. TaxID=660 RepID=UPI00299E229A|nr:hypothetical protein [Photobacterium sp.]MDX1303755.1 hypothetical protein [Photobacterium sp.]